MTWMRVIGSGIKPASRPDVKGDMAVRVLLSGLEYLHM
jgi:hypothetical protein